jgi:GNAT superfamily N-acetyltransferase
MTITRPASLQDSAAVASLMRCASTELMRKTTIIGCHGLEAYIHDQIAAGSPNHYLVAAADNRLVGMSAWRCEGEHLFLNHLFVNPSAQGQGAGTALCRLGITHASFHHARFLALDVHEDNPRARSWYHALGLAMEERNTLMEVPLCPATSTSAREWSSSFNSVSDSDYARYGFSQFKLRTEHATYTIGRLGGSLFRVVSSALLKDEIALNALYTLDNKRALLCIGSDKELEVGAKRGGVVIGRIERLVARLDTVAARIRGAVSGRMPV